MLRIALAGALMLASVGAYAQFNKCARGFCPGGFPGPGVTTQGGSLPAATGKILLVDGASFILLTDGASKLCRAGGC